MFKNAGSEMNKTSIVVVDDDAGMRAYLSDFLSHVGYDVHAVTNGAQLLDRLTAGPAPSLTLLTW
jgi:CheY-like chemotaxis protein